MTRIANIIALRTAFVLPTAWALMMAFALCIDGDVHKLLALPYFLFLGAAATSLALSCRPAPFALMHLVNASSLLVAAGLVGAVRLSLALI